jgi:phosphoribosylanthranilate isomerase
VAIEQSLKRKWRLNVAPMRLVYSWVHTLKPRKLIARDILQSLPPFVTGVLVTTCSTAEEIQKLINTTGATIVQCHSDIQPEYIAQLRSQFPAVKFIAVVHITDQKSIEAAMHASRYTDALLLDTAYKGAAGGTGITHDWSISAAIIQKVSVPVILAGGLNPENVQEAITAVRPYAVDVRSGVSDSTGEKNTEKMQAFIRNAHTL